MFGTLDSSRKLSSKYTHMQKDVFSCVSHCFVFVHKYILAFFCFVYFIIYSPVYLLFTTFLEIQLYFRSPGISNASICNQIFLFFYFWTKNTCHLSSGVLMNFHFFVGFLTEIGEADSLIIKRKYVHVYQTCLWWKMQTNMNLVFPWKWSNVLGMYVLFSFEHELSKKEHRQPSFFEWYSWCGMRMKLTEK